MPTIQYQFKWRLFSRRPCTCPYPWAGPQSRLQRLDLIIQLSSICFNFVFHSIRDALSSMGGVDASFWAAQSSYAHKTFSQWRGQSMSRSVCRKISHMQFALRLILRYLADALNCLYFFGYARWLEPLIVQNNYLIYCRRMIHQNVTEISWESRLVPIFLALHAWTCFEGSFRYLFEATSVLLLLFYVIIIFDVL